MGRSAKFHKRQGAKKAASSAAPAPKPVSKPKPKPAPAAASAAPARERKTHTGAKLRAKAGTHRQRDGAEGHVLGAADYVALMLGGRRKAAAEAARLPKDKEEDEGGVGDAAMEMGE